MLWAGGHVRQARRSTAHAMVQEGIDTRLRWLDGTEGWCCSINNFCERPRVVRQENPLSCVGEAMGPLQAAMLASPCVEAGGVDPSSWRCGKVSFPSKSTRVPGANRVLPSDTLFSGGCRRGWNWHRLVMAGRKRRWNSRRPQASADRAWQVIQFSDVTHGMRLAGAGLPEADLPEACSSGAPGTAVDWSKGSSLPSRMTNRRRGMVASRRRNTLLTRWAPLVCRTRRVRLLLRSTVSRYPLCAPAFLAAEVAATHWLPFA